VSIGKNNWEVAAFCVATCFAIGILAILAALIDIVEAIEKGK